MALSLAHRIFRGTVHGMERTLKAVSPELYFKTVAELFEEVDATYRVETSKGPLFIHCASETVRIRASHTFAREPDTVAWIDGFAPGDVLWDIGANIGMFSLYAARSAARVVAFDPLPLNYSGLVQNLVLNDLHGQVMPFCVALSDVTQVAPLAVPEEATMMGGAGGVFNATTDNYGQPVNAVFELPALGYAVDDFLDRFGVPFPNHIKVDIDGILDRVIRGARRTLRDPRLKSAMLELQPMPEQSRFILDEMNAAGFTLAKTVSAVGAQTAEIDTHVTNNFFVRPA